MEQSIKNTNSTTNQKPHFNNSIPVELERRFQAPVDRLWKAWSTPEMTKQWWGPANYTCPDAQIDFRVGGQCLLAMKGPDGRTNWSGGEYREIIPHKKIVCTDRFTDEKGNPISAQDVGMPGDWPEESYLTINFEDLGKDCRMTLKHEGIPKEMHDDCVSGWSSSIDKLQRLVEHS